MNGTSPVATSVEGYAKSLKACTLKATKKNGTEVERAGFIHSVKDSRSGKVVVFLDIMRKAPRNFKLDNVISVVDY